MLFRRYTKAYFSCLFLSTDKYCILNYVYNAADELKYKNKILYISVLNISHLQVTLRIGGWWQMEMEI